MFFSERFILYWKIQHWITELLLVVSYYLQVVNSRHNFSVWNLVVNSIFKIMACLESKISGAYYYLWTNQLWGNFFESLLCAGVNPHFRFFYLAQSTWQQICWTCTSLIRTPHLTVFKFVIWRNQKRKCGVLFGLSVKKFQNFFFNEFGMSTLLPFWRCIVVSVGQRPLVVSFCWAGELWLRQWRLKDITLGEQGHWYSSWRNAEVTESALPW